MPWNLSAGRTRRAIRVVACRAALIAGAILMIDSGCTGGAATPTSNQSSRPAATQPTTTGPHRASDARRTYPLDSLPTATATIDKHVFRIWIASAFDQQRPDVTQEGLMFVPADEIDADQGMLFILPEQIQNFWMRNTITPLDIAYARADGRIVAIWQMPPLTLDNFPSGEPATFALEVKQGTFEALGIKVGDTLELPADLLKPQR